MISTHAFVHAQVIAPVVLHLDHPAAGDFPLATSGHATAIYLSPEDAPQLEAATTAFADDVHSVTGHQPQLIEAAGATLPPTVILVGTIGRSAILTELEHRGKLDARSLHGAWESSITTVVDDPLPGVRRALVIAGSDRRGAAYALFDLSRAMGVSPWVWWADVPVRHHRFIGVPATTITRGEPAVRYRGIFLNDEDWGLRPWAAKKMDPSLHNIGPHTYARIFELLLRLRADSLWPAMHPGTLAFNAVPKNAQLADRWGIVMGSSHSEALLRNNVGEWNEKTDGPWNYQLNKPAIDAYWEKRLEQNGHFENFYTVGMRGVHDTGLEATGTTEQKARLVEQVMQEQRALLAAHVDPHVDQIPQVIWLYKESLELYRAGMKVPEDVTLGWTDDNYGYIRQLPTLAEQQRPGGSGLYYHVSYWGFPHDYLWLCSTPPSLMREELTKAYDHDVRRYWVLNVGDLKPAESDIDYFMQLAWSEPRMAPIQQTTFLRSWFAEQFPAAFADKIAAIMDRYYQLNFVRKPEFMGFNGYDDAIRRTAFNPLAWGDQNTTRDAAWQQLSSETEALAHQLPARYHNAYFELVAYPVEAAAAQNRKLLATDRSFLFAQEHREAARVEAAQQAHAAYDRIQSITAEYNSLADGKWDGMMSAAPRDRQVFRMPVTATAADASLPLPASWGRGSEADAQATISINAAHFLRSNNGTFAAKDETAHWRVLPQLGISGASVLFGSPGLLANHEADAASDDAPWLEYAFDVRSSESAQLAIYTLPTFPLDAAHRLSFGVSVDGAAPSFLDAGATGEWHENTAPVWAANVLRNAAILTLPLGTLTPGRHTLRLVYRDPGVVFEHIVVSFPHTPPAYPVPPESAAHAHASH
jgi:hypothetical protein